MTARAAPGPEELDLLLPVFSDEELAAVSQPGPPDGRFAPLARFDALGPDEKTVALTTARASLRARGYLDDDSRPQEALAQVLEARNRPLCVGIAETERGGTTSSLYLYGLRDDVVLEETIEDGLHRFVMRTYLRAAASIAAFFDPEGWATEEEPAVVSEAEGEPSFEPIEAAIQGAEIIGRLWIVRRTAADRTDEIRINVAAQPGRIIVVTGYTKPGEKGALFAKPVSKETFVAVILKCLQLEATQT